LQKAREQVADQRRESKNAARETRRATRECTQTYRELPELFRSRVSPTAPQDWSAISYPTVTELTGLRGKRGELDPDTLDQRLDEAKRHRSDRQEKLLQARQAKNDLVADHKQRLRLRKAYREAEEQHQLYRIVAELLGPRRLQLHLLRH